MFTGSIELSKLIGAEIHEREFNGEIVKCISIPIEENDFPVTSKNRVFLRFVMKEKRPNPYNVSHYISLFVGNKEIIKQHKLLGYDKMVKFIGNARLYEYNRKQYPRKLIPLEKAMDL